MRKTLWTAFVLLLCAGGAIPVYAAANAEFQGNCMNTSPVCTSCVFDATRTSSGASPTSCSPSTISYYFWDFGDGTNSGFVTSSTVSHTYCGPGLWSICLSVFCADGSSDTQCHCIAKGIGIFGCIIPDTGWSPP